MAQAATDCWCSPLLARYSCAAEDFGVKMLIVAGVS